MKTKSNFRVSLGLFVLTLMLTSCGQQVKEVEKKVFYPPPPSLPRLQYLTAYSTSADIEGKNAFEEFVVGKKQIRGLDKPYGVAMWRGKIYVCDTNRTLMVFDLIEKKFGRLKGAQGLGTLKQPLNIDIDEEGNKYVVDPIRGQVVKYDQNDFYVDAVGIPGTWKPVDVEVYRDRIYVADLKDFTIKIFEKDTMKFIKKIGQNSERREENLAMPINIAFSEDGYMYVTDAARFQVLKFDRDGHFLGTIGKHGDHPGEFARPRGVAVDREGRIYVVDAAFDNVQIFDPEGHLLTFFGGPGNKPGNLFLPAAVYIDYDQGDIELFNKYIDPKFKVEYLVLVTSQFGERLVNIYAFGKEKGKHYPTIQELIEMRKRQLEELQKTFGTEEGKTEQGGKGQEVE